MERKKESLKRGSHQSDRQHTEFLCNEFVDMIHKGQWILLPAHLVLADKNLRLSPLGVVPQRDRRPRTICDYSFFFVNLDTIPLAPAESMQFGRALWRILQQVYDADPRLGPVHLSKIDISDGFYRIWINATDVPTLGIMFPIAPGAEPLVGFPLVLPMGWMQSPPLFTATTEKVADLANHQLALNAPCPAHRLDLLSEAAPPPGVPATSPVHGPTPLALPPKGCPTGRPHPAMKAWDAYVDDFIGMVQGGAAHRRYVKRTLLHALDKVFRKLEPGDDLRRQEPAPLKKMHKGDAMWATRKAILGWTVDTLVMTIELPPQGLERLFELLHSVPPKQKQVSTNKWQKMLGELRSMVLAIPGGRGLFSVLQEVLRYKCDGGNRLCLTQAVHGVFSDFHWLASDLERRPACIAELIPTRQPVTIGTQDAAGSGMGGVHFVPLPDGTIQPLLWRSPFKPRITNQLVTFANPSGTCLLNKLTSARLPSKTYRTTWQQCGGNGKALPPPQAQPQD
jgi:hypothetical protein